MCAHVRLPPARGFRARARPPPPAASRRARALGLPCCLQAGQEKYHSLAPMYYRGAAAAIVVYDITQASSFVTLKNWVKELQTLGPENIVIAVCGNKLDQEDRRVRGARSPALDSGASVLGPASIHLCPAARRSRSARSLARSPLALRSRLRAGGAAGRGRGLCARD